ncbi:MAG: hypothetical protein V4558_17025 [Gemmatimonadota bacterium]
MWALILAALFVGGSWRAVAGRRGPKNWWVRGGFLLGAALLFPVLIREILIGRTGPTRAGEALVGAIGFLLLLGARAFATERKRAVRERLRLVELDIDSGGIDENLKWVREQVTERLTAEDWRGVLPLVADGWNGGFAWLTPEFVRGQLAKTLPAAGETQRHVPPSPQGDL